MVNEKLLSMLSTDELKVLCDEYLLQLECITLMQVTHDAHIKSALDLCRKLSGLRSKNLEWDCIQRIHSILDLCHGRT